MTNVPAEERLTSAPVTYAVLAMSLRESDPDRAMGALRRAEELAERTADPFIAELPDRARHRGSSPTSLASFSTDPSQLSASRRSGAATTHCTPAAAYASYSDRITSGSTLSGSQSWV